ncbi:hypothetical protein CYFUS_000494 [Cystobacter fuscus]|uniref:Uncharacterized protein n=1 Tax=Cystobacter fuscus TaxID=43 RepID=A0A250IV15_9BACT|nr:DUF2267 domain-containing protein [Cystobacter fuscus]ATB35082.1 hypothetical protein CYFUS_000494 [Cystobacter fuscus]
MSDTPPGNPLSRGDKRPPSRPGPSSAAFTTSLVQEGRLDPGLAECAAASVVTALLRNLELDEDQEPRGHLMRRLVEFLPARDAGKGSLEPISGQEALFTSVARELRLEVSAVEPLVRTVFQTLRGFLSEGECQDVERGLSWDLHYLWRRTQ